MKSPMLPGRGMDGFGDAPEPRSEGTNFIFDIARRWRLVVGIMLCCLAAIAIRLLLSPPVYHSEARVFVHRGALLAIGDQGNSHASNLLTQCRVVTSTRIIADAAVRAQPKAPRSLPANEGMARLTAGLGATVVQGEDLITISFDGPDAAEAAVIVQGVIDAYVDFHVDRKMQLLAQWKKDCDDLRAEIAAGNKALNDLRQKSEAMVDGAGVGGTSREDLGVLREALSAATVEALNAQVAYQTALQGFDSGKMVADSAQVAGASITGTSAAENTPGVTLREQLAAARDRLRELRGRFLENHPTVRAAEAHIASLEAAVAQANHAAAEDRLAALKQHSVSAAERRNLLQKQYQTFAQAAVRQNRDSAEIERREGELSRSQKQLDVVISRIQQYHLDADASSGTVEVVEYPSINLEPISPHKQRNILAALIGGLMLGGLTAAMLGRFDQRVRSAAELSAEMRLPVLGAVPRFRGGAADHALGKVVMNDPTCDTAEACRSVRTAVFFGSGQREPRTILITSADAGEGKSTIASNLAIAMARAGRKVLLLDADLRKPVQHRVFRTIARGDLERVLAGDQTLESAIQASEIENLSLFLCARAPANPSELLNNPAFASLLEELSIRYDHVVVDSPPVSVASDSRILSAFTAVSLLVVRADRTRRSAVKLAYEALSSVGGSVLGMVLNHASHRDDRFGSYGYYYSNHGGPGAGETGVPRVTAPAGLIDSASMNKVSADDEKGTGLNSLPA